MTLAAKLPSSVRLVEVGPRDGLQNEKAMVPTDVKVALIDRLTDAGFPAIEATSFVSPKWVPQMADAADVMARIRRKPGVRYPVLTPNMKGFEAALAAKADEVAVFVAASETFSRKNINCSIAESLERAQPIFAAAKPTACACAATSRACSAARTRATSIRARWREIAAALFAMGAYEVSLGDTIGVGTAGKTAALFALVARARAGRGARRPLPRHLRPGADQRLRGDGDGRGHVRLLGRGAGRLSLREGRDRQRRERGRRLPAARPRHRHRRRPDEAARRRADASRISSGGRRCRASRARSPRRAAAGAHERDASRDPRRAGGPRPVALHQRLRDGRATARSASAASARSTRSPRGACSTPTRSARVLAALPARARSARAPRR